MKFLLRIFLGILIIPILLPILVLGGMAWVLANFMQLFMSVVFFVNDGEWNFTFWPD